MIVARETGWLTRDHRTIVDAELAPQLESLGDRKTENQARKIAYRLDLTPAQLKITYTALKSFLDDFGHDERLVHEVVREVLSKLPEESAIRSIDISKGR